MKVYSCGRAAIISTTDDRNLTNGNLFSHISGGQKSKINILAGLASSQASLLGQHVAIVFWIFVCLFFVDSSLLVDVTCNGFENSNPGHLGSSVVEHLPLA